MGGGWEGDGSVLSGTFSPPSKHNVSPTLEEDDSSRIELFRMFRILNFVFREPRILRIQAVSLRERIRSPDQKGTKDEKDRDSRFPRTRIRYNTPLPVKEERVREGRKTIASFYCQR